MIRKKLKCAVLGSSGLIGQQFLRMLDDHPLFEVTEVFGSERSDGKKINDQWNLPSFSCPESVKDLVLRNVHEHKPRDVDVVFSGLPSSVAGPIEEQLRKEGLPVFSNAASHRYDSDVPILIPEINASHLRLVKAQRARLETDGFIVTNSNCSISGAAIFLHELSKIVPIRTVVVSTYQALSGAGFNGVRALDISGNVIPFIKNEEEKLRIEGQKILGTIGDDGFIVGAPVQIIANCARVNVIYGHLEAVTAISDLNVEDLLDASNLVSRLKEVKSPLNRSRGYHCAPESHLVVKEGVDRPQPQIDAFEGSPEPARGMAVSIGRIRVFQNSVSAYVLVHNTIRGGAGGSILNAEHALIEGVI